MLSKQVVVSQNRYYHDTNGKDFRNRQFILVLLGLSIAFFQIIHVFATRTNSVPRHQGSDLNLADKYTIGYNGENLVLLTEQWRSDRDGYKQFQDEDLLHGIGNIPADVAPLFFRPIQINSASTNLLATIPGIGPHLSQQIQDYIINNGAILRISELENVKGIGEQKLKQIAKHIRI